MKVSVFGVGYVGLVQAAVLADAGHFVCCYDSDFGKIERLTKGELDIFEPGLSPLLVENIQNGRLTLVSDIRKCVDFGTVLFIAVGTPSLADGSADLSSVTDVASNIGHFINEDKIVVNKSTVPVGTADQVSKIITRALSNRQVSYSVQVVSNPEFLKEGSAVSDCKRPDRIIIGTDDHHTQKVMRELYQPFNRNHEKVIIMDSRSAELTKYAANSLLATKISFMNEMANIAEHVGADIEAVRQGIGSDPRIGYHFIYPGCGYGGSCFPKDVSALQKNAIQAGYTPSILPMVEYVNAKQKKRLVEKIQQTFLAFGEMSLQGKTFALWGLSFKPNTDDMREAPSRVIMETLWKLGATIKAYDPQAMEQAGLLYAERNDLTLVETKEAALVDADALIICTEWQSFKAPDWQELKLRLTPYGVNKERLLFDGRNLFEPETMAARGFKYVSIGRGAGSSASL